MIWPCNANDNEHAGEKTKQYVSQHTKLLAAIKKKKKIPGKDTIKFTRKTRRKKDQRMNG